MFDKALYYPSIEIRDEKWLKSSALYWDKISTIVPNGLRDPYDYDCSYLQDEGILEQEVVRGRTLRSKTIKDKVLDYFSTYENYYANNYRRDRNVNRIYWEKLDPELYELIRRNYNRYNDDFFYADDYFMDFYMTLLANHIAKRKGMNLITDTQISNQVGIGVSNDIKYTYTPRRNYYEQDEVHRLTESILAQMSINHFGVSPDTNIKDIVAFRKKYNDYLCKYRLEVQRLSDTLKDTNFETFEALKSAIDSIIRNEISVSLNDLESALMDSKINFYIAPLTVTGIIGIASKLKINPAITLGTASVVIGSKVILAKRKKAATLRKNNYAYLQLMRNNL